MESMYDIVVTIMGTPTNEFESVIAYLGAFILTLLFMYEFLAMFQLIGGRR